MSLNGTERIGGSEQQCQQPKSPVGESDGRVVSGLGGIADQAHEALDKARKHVPDSVVLGGVRPLLDSLQV